MNSTTAEVSYNGSVHNATDNQSRHCELFTSDFECDLLVYTKRIACSLSVLGAVATFVIIIAFKKYKEFYQRLIANLSLGSLLFAVSFLVSDFSSTSKELCVFQGALMTYSAWTIMLSVMMISGNLYSVVTTGRDFKSREKFLTLCCWLVPLLPSGLPFVSDVYGPAGVWCWMKDDWRWRFGTWYIWDGLSDIVFFGLISHIIYRLRRKGNDRMSKASPEAKAMIYKDIRTLRIYPFVYFVINLFPMTQRIYNAATEHNGRAGYYFPLLFLQTLTGPLFGAVVAVVFVLDRRTCKALTQKGTLHSVLRKWSQRNAVREFPEIYGINDQSTSTTGDTFM